MRNRDHNCYGSLKFGTVDLAEDYDTWLNIATNAISVNWANEPGVRSRQRIHPQCNYPLTGRDANMEKTWILIANAERASCYERHAPDRILTKLADFTHPHTALSAKTGEGDLTGAAGKGHGRTEVLS